MLVRVEFQFQVEGHMDTAYAVSASADGSEYHDGIESNVELSLMRLYTEVCDRSLIRTYGILGLLFSMSHDTLVYGTPCRLIVKEVLKCAYMEGGRARLLKVMMFLFGADYASTLDVDRICLFLSIYF